MKKFEFSLGKVLELKNQLLDKEKHTLGALRQERHRLARLRDEWNQQFQVLNQKMDAAAREGTTIQELRSIRFQMDSLELEIQILDTQVATQDEKIASQLMVVLGITQEVSGLDKLKGYQKEEYDKDVARAEETEIAEFVSGKLLRQQHV